MSAGWRSGSWPGESGGRGSRECGATSRRRAKAGIEALTRVLAVELAPHHIQVNAVAPAMVKTGFSAPFWSNEDIREKIVAAVPVGRLPVNR